MPSDIAIFERAMREAVALARNGRFFTAPNPCVGAVLLRGGVIVAQGFHERAGGPHAEINALEDAKRKGVNPVECDLVVTLEPCRHHGKTPPCTDAILKAGIRRVAIGVLDPTPEAAGGADILRQNGVEVVSGFLEQESLDLIADFLTWQTTDQPYTILKLAATLDGRIATRTGHSRWISCEETRARVHAVRRHAGAVLVGGNTFYQDNPQLTCRPGPGEPKPESQPLAVVVTSRLPAPDMPCRLLQERPADVIFWTPVAAAASPKAEALRKKGVRVFGLPHISRVSGSAGDRMRSELDLREGLASLRRDHGCRYVMCEGGGRIGLSLLEKNLASELLLHLSPRILADNEATPLFDGLSPLQIDESIPLRITDTCTCGTDLIVSLRPETSVGEAAKLLEA